MESKFSKYQYDDLDKAALTMIYGIFALVFLMAVACVGGGAWVLYIITTVVKQ